MIKPIAKKYYTAHVILIGSLLFLTGCFNWNKKDSHEPQDIIVGNKKGELLLSIDGKPVLYAQDFEDQKAMALQTEPRLQMLLQMYPDAERTMIFDSLKYAHIIKEYVHRHGLDQTEEFQSNLRNAQEAFYIQMCMKAYQDANPITVTPEEAKAYYEKNKDRIQGLAISSGGVDLLVASFESKDEADRFAHKVKDGSKKHFDAAAKELNIDVMPMVISQEGYADETIKNAALSVTKFPSKQILDMNNGSYVVVGFLGKKPAEYHSFDLPEVQKAITDMCINEKREAAQLAEIDKLKDEYNVVEYTAYFDKKAEAAANVQKSLQKAQELAMKAQQGVDHDDMTVCEEEIVFEDKI